MYRSLIQQTRGYSSDFCLKTLTQRVFHVIQIKHNTIEKAEVTKGIAFFASGLIDFSFV